MSEHGIGRALLHALGGAFLVLGLDAFTEGILSSAIMTSEIFAFGAIIVGGFLVLGLPNSMHPTGKARRGD